MLFSSCNGRIRTSAQLWLVAPRPESPRYAQGRWEGPAELDHFVAHGQPLSGGCVADGDFSETERPPRSHTPLCSRIPDPSLSVLRSLLRVSAALAAAGRDTCFSAQRVPQPHLHTPGLLWAVTGACRRPDFRWVFFRENILT